MTNGCLSQTDLEIIGHMTLFDNFTPDEITRLAQFLNVTSYPAGTHLYDPGEPAERMYGILSGWVKTRRLSSNGDYAVLATYSVGETVGEAHAALGNTFCDSAVCADECRVFTLERNDLTELLADIPKLQVGLMATISRHLDEANENLEVLKTLNGEQRLIRFLLRLANSPRTPTVVALPFEKILIAEQLGMTPESLSRNFAKLRELGVSVRGRRVRINAPERLYDRLKANARPHAGTSA